MKPITSIDEARRAIEDFSGRPEDFLLPVSEQLLDPVGVNMAIIGDWMLKRGWAPNGFEQRDGFRIYRYKTLS